jgi:hypothetical protein
MTIGILTFPQEINHGAFFQAYALQNYLVSQGSNVELINYKNKNYYINEYKIWLFHKNFSLVFHNIRKILKFRIDQKHLNLTKFTTKKSNIDITKYDIIIVGSDIVWDYNNDLIGRDPIFFGEGLDTKKLIAYAASCCDADINEFPQYVKDGLPRFDFISVRDNNTAELVNKVLRCKPLLVADPVFLYDFSKIQLKRKHKAPYLLIYAYLLTEKEKNDILLFAGQRGLEVVSLAYNNPWCDKNYIAVGPFEWLSYFRYAEYIVTSTFHGVMFSIVYEKNFAVNGHRHIQNKLSYILKITNLETRLLEKENVISLLQNSINYDMVKKLLLPLINDSKTFLMSTINGENCK